MAEEQHVTTEQHSHDHHHSDTFVIPWLNREMTLPGGIYTFVFVLLAVLTIIEVGLTVIFPENAFIIGLLIVMSLAKAFLVVTFYMHLREDNPIYRLVLLLPLLIVALSVVYLIFVPVGAGLGYS